jgi:hypothetical protein
LFAKEVKKKMNAALLAPGLLCPKTGKTCLGHFVLASFRRAAVILI